MKETIVVNVVAQVILQVDRGEWDDGWDLKQEIGEQMSFDDALEWEIVDAQEVSGADV